MEMKRRPQVDLSLLSNNEKAVDYKAPPKEFTEQLILPKRERTEGDEVLDVKAEQKMKI